MQEGSSCNKGAVLLSNPEDCQSFLICGANNKYLKQLCPIGLHFDGENRVCNHPQVVNCKLDQEVAESFEDNSQSQNIGSQSSFSQNELVEILMKDDSKIFSNGFELTLEYSDDHNIDSDVNNPKMYRTILDTQTDEDDEEDDDDNGHNNQSLDQNISQELEEKLIEDNSQSLDNQPALDEKNEDENDDDNDHNTEGGVNIQQRSDNHTYSFRHIPEDDEPTWIHDNPKMPNVGIISKPAASVQECAYYCSNDQDCCMFEFTYNSKWCQLYDECIPDLHLPQQNPIEQTNQSFDGKIFGNKTTEAHQTLTKNNNDQTLNENISNLDEEAHHQIQIETNNQHLDENTIQEIDENLIEDNNQPFDNQSALDENFSQEAYETPFESNNNQPTVSQNL